MSTDGISYEYTVMKVNFAIELVFMVLLVFSIRQLRTKYGTYIYSLWWTFSFSFFVFAAILVSSRSLLGDIGEKLGSGAHTYAIDFPAELKFVSAIAIIAVAPQILAYALSGI